MAKKPATKKPTTKLQFTAALCVSRRISIKTIVVFISTLIGVVIGFAVSPDLAGYPMIATEEQLEILRREKIKEYLLVGVFMGGFSGLITLIIKAKLFIPYACMVLMVALYIVFESYRVQGFVTLLEFLQIDYLAFFISGCTFCGAFQFSKYYHALKYT